LTEKLKENNRWSVKTQTKIMDAKRAKTDSGISNFMITYQKVKILFDKNK